MTKITRTPRLAATKAPLLLAVVLALVTTACGKDSAATSGTPTAPSTAAPTVTSVTVAGLDAVRTGFYSDYSATATLSDGTSQNVSSSATWSSSNSSVGDVEPSGRLTGRTHGTIVLSATYQGRTNSKTVNIVNNYGGTWTGVYTATACDASGAFASVGWCRGVVGVPAALSMDLTQSGNDRSRVSGTLTNLFIRDAPVTGNVTGDGRLVISADATGTTSGVTFRFQLGGWDTRLTASSHMSGKTAVAFSAVGVSGNAYEEHNITTATLTSPQLNPAMER